MKIEIFDTEKHKIIESYYDEDFYKYINKDDYVIVNGLFYKVKSKIYNIICDIYIFEVFNGQHN